MITPPATPPPSPPPAAVRRADTPAPLPSEALLKGRKTVEISHNGAVYRLQATRQGKLILTK
ncbi:MAG: hemin uptake protein HemP [Burkholderiaceae bacterium]